MKCEAYLRLIATSAHFYLVGDMDRMRIADGAASAHLAGCPLCNPARLAEGLFGRPVVVVDER